MKVFLCFSLLMATAQAGFLGNSGSHVGGHSIQLLKVIHENAGGHSQGGTAHGSHGSSGAAEVYKLVHENHANGHNDASHGHGGEVAPPLIKIIHQHVRASHGGSSLSHGTPAKVIHVIHEHKFPELTPTYASIPIAAAPLPLATSTNNYAPAGSAPSYAPASSNGYHAAAPAAHVPHQTYGQPQ